ncbi:hypothetical protein OH76DRAFT_1123804 [Lentinus brumalis]|uniref:DUF6534 domain-containing protein n=1 Tax=Lentinus brumalis TaxID=2498619 RepID=A0A371CUT1_9APHY|nr:hypothetical protein OH76DRAFT_1123804 [Polyporus brumalis]
MSYSHELAARTIAATLVAAPELPALDNTYGALFLGMVFGLMLYGLTVHQTYRYLRLYPSDRHFLFWLVITIVILETVHTVAIIAACYWHLITNFFNPLSLQEGYWGTRVLTPVTGLTILVCQCFYARRVWYVGPKYRYLVGVAGCLIVVIFGLTVAATVETIRLSLADFQHVSWLVSALFGVAVSVDIILTTTLIVILLRSRTGFKRTDSTLGVIVVYTVNTGLLTSIVGLFCFVFAIILPGNIIYIGISIVGTKLYANSVLAVLNSRRALSNRMLEGDEMGSFEPRVAVHRPHTQAETWDIPQADRPVDAGSAMSFVRPTDLTTNFTTELTTLDSETAGTRSVMLQFGLNDKKADVFEKKSVTSLPV